ncbi:MAG: restriction endonuclease subunit S [Candidatus Atribacteria bacterium]|nr:restriction endonuclease subunit S [Candidatus Atribacteria bacterium]
MTVLSNNWITTDLESITEILDYKRVPINSEERQKRKENKILSELYPYYGATGQVDYINDYLFDGEYVLLGEDGAPFLDSLKNKAYIVSGKFWVNNHAHILKGYISNKYLCFYLNQYNFIGHVTGTTRLKLNQSSMKSITIKVAPLNEQNRIVQKIEELFSDLDKATEDLKKTREKLKIYRKAVLKAAFEGKLTEEWRKKNIPRLAEEVLKIKNENIDELFKVPKSWKWLKILHIGEVETGTTPRKNVKSNYGDDYPFYKPTDLETGINVRNAREYLSVKGLKKARFLPKNSILVTCIGATIGKTGIIRLPGASNQQINAIIPYKFTNPDFIYYQVISPYFQEQIISKSSSTTLPILNKSRFKELLIVMATKEEQEQILQEIESRLSVCDKVEKTVEQNLNKIEYLRQSILKKAFEGKLVPQDPNDLPAGELLKQIKIKKDKMSKNGK